MNLSQEYKVVYMRFKHSFSPKEIAEMLNMGEDDVRYILAVEANECERQRVIFRAEQEFEESIERRKKINTKRKIEI